MEKRDRVVYWVVTGLLSVMMVMAAVMYFAKYEMVSETFTRLGFPTYLIYPLAIAKFLGIAAILTRKSECLKELAYAGFFFTFILAFSAHFNAGDGELAPAAIAMILLVCSHIFGEKVFSQR
jgi:hypothetical protein